MRLQEPETKTAFLPCYALPGKRATLHKYVFSERTTVKATTPGKPDQLAIAFVFRCTETGALRRWGIENIGGTIQADDEDN